MVNILIERFSKHLETNTFDSCSYDLNLKWKELLKIMPPLLTAGRYFHLNFKKCELFCICLLRQIVNLVKHLGWTFLQEWLTALNKNC